jgi:hypothetical protein
MVVRGEGGCHSGPLANRAGGMCGSKGSGPAARSRTDAHTLAACPRGRSAPPQQQHPGCRLCLPAPRVLALRRPRLSSPSPATAAHVVGLGPCGCELCCAVCCKLAAAAAAGPFSLSSRPMPQGPLYLAPSDLISQPQPLRSTAARRSSLQRARRSILGSILSSAPAASPDRGRDEPFVPRRARGASSSRGRAADARRRPCAVRKVWEHAHAGAL